jgi:hypothetical protein
MISLSATLLAAQRAMKATPYIRVAIGSSVFETDRVISYTREGQPFNEKVTLIIANEDGALDGLVLEGKTVTLGRGFVTTGGNEYCNLPPLVALKPQFFTASGKRLCQITCIGKVNEIAEDRASVSYTPDGTLTAKTLYSQIAASTLAPFTHCPALTIEWGTLDTLFDTIKPKTNYRIYTNNARLGAMRRLIDFTYNAMRIKQNGSLYVFRPTTSGTTYDYEYSSSVHIIHDKYRGKRLVVPNHITVRTPTAVTPAYSGTAIDTDSTGKYRTVQAFFEYNLISNAQAADIAAAILAKYQMNQRYTVAHVPINLGQELYDYVKMTDFIDATVETGNVGYINEVYRPADNLFEATIGLGGWWTHRAESLAAEVGGETGDSSVENMGDIAVGTIYLNPINLDVVVDGITYKRTKSGALSADGLVLLDQIVNGSTYKLVLATQINAGKIYLSSQCDFASGYNPITKEWTISKQATAPTSPVVGQMWQDTSTTPNVIKYWNGSTWVAAGVSNLDQLPNGTQFHRVATASLDANGLILLDQVQIGSNYDLIAKADISAHHILLSSTIQNASYQTATSAEKSSWTGKPNNMDDIPAGSTYSKVLGTDIQSGHIKVYSGTIFNGVWYDTSYVDIDQASGITFYGYDSACRFFYGGTSVGLIKAQSNYLLISAGANRIELYGQQGIVIPWASSYPVARAGCGFYHSTEGMAYIYSGGAWRHWQY